MLQGWSLCRGCLCLWCPPQLKNKGNAFKMGSRVGWCTDELHPRGSKGFSAHLWAMEGVGGGTSRPAWAFSGASLRLKHPCGVCGEG